MQSLLDDVNKLLSKNHGDESRLLHIKETIEKNKILYVSDRKYLTNLCKRHLNQKNPEVKKQVFLKYSQKSESELYSENENIVKIIGFNKCNHKNETPTSVRALPLLATETNKLRQYYPITTIRVRPAASERVTFTELDK